MSDQLEQMALLGKKIEQIGILQDEVTALYKAIVAHLDMRQANQQVDKLTRNQAVGTQTEVNEGTPMAVLLINAHQNQYGVYYRGYYVTPEQDEAESAVMWSSKPTAKTKYHGTVGEKNSPLFLIFVNRYEKVSLIRADSKELVARGVFAEASNYEQPDYDYIIRLFPVEKEEEGEEQPTINTQVFQEKAKPKFQPTEVEEEPEVEPTTKKKFKLKGLS